MIETKIIYKEGEAWQDGVVARLIEVPSSVYQKDEEAHMYIVMFWVTKDGKVISKDRYLVDLERCQASDAIRHIIQKVDELKNEYFPFGNEQGERKVYHV